MHIQLTDMCLFWKKKHILKENMQRIQIILRKPHTYFSDIFLHVYQSTKSIVIYDLFYLWIYVWYLQIVVTYYEVNINCYSNIKSL